MSKGLILREDVNKEEFDMLKLETQNVSQFIAYYALLLSTACQYGLIGQIEAEEISKRILGTFDEKFGIDSRIMANNMYVLTCYLQTMKNSKQIETLTNNSIQDLFDKANIWFVSELNIVEKLLLEIKALVYKLNDELIIKSFEGLVIMVQDCKSFSKEGTKCDLKKVHQTVIPMVYQTSHRGEISEKNFLRTLRQTVEKFAIEVSILNKLNPLELMKNIKSSNKRELNQIVLRSDVQKKKLEKELEKAKNALNDELERASKISMQTRKKLDDLEKEDREVFKKLNPDLEGKAFEIAFENWQDTLPEEHFDIYDDECEDEFEISEKARQKYREIELEILSKLDALDKASDKDFVEAESLQTMNMSLDTIFKIQAIIELQKLNSNIRIPLNSQELYDALEEFELSKAVQVVLATIKPNFSETEIEYLKNV